MHLPASAALRGRIHRSQNSVSGETVVILKRTSEVTPAGLAAVRLTWITAILVCGLALLSGLLSGSGGGGSSHGFPGFAFSGSGDSAPFADVASLDPAALLLGGDAQDNAPKAQKTETAGSHGYRGQWVKEQARGDSHSGDSQSRAGVPHPGRQPEGPGGNPPSSTSGPNRPQAPPVSLPKPPQAPTVTVNVPKPPQAPSVSVSTPNPPQESSETSGTSGTSAPSLPQVSVNVSAPVQTPVVTIPDVSVQLP
jgi:hypothetical protein